jgi:hypothetical protein
MAGYPFCASYAVASSRHDYSARSATKFDRWEQCGSLLKLKKTAEEKKDFFAKRI